MSPGMTCVEMTYVDSLDSKLHEQWNITSTYYL